MHRRPRLLLDISSVRLNTSGSGRSSMRALPGGRFEAVNARLRDLISTAFAMEPFQEIEGPKRLLDSRFDISAASSEKVDLPDRPRPGPFHIALQGLLNARFGLKAHVSSGVP